jgi:hypothetical protein
MIIRDAGLIPIVSCQVFGTAYCALKNQREKYGSCIACAPPFLHVTKISDSTITLKRKLILYC